MSTAPVDLAALRDQLRAMENNLATDGTVRVESEYLEVIATRA